jgi:phosphoglycerate dehydrogenase-like enzyme
MRTFVFSVALLLGAAAMAAEAPAPLPKAVQMIADLEIREGATPVRADPRWHPPARILLRAGFPGFLPSLQAMAPGVELVVAKSDAEAVALAGDVDAVIGICTPEVVAAAKKALWIQLFSAGSEGCVTIPAVRERRLLLTNMQRISSPEIAEHTLAMLLAFTRGLNLYLPDQKSGRWNKELVPREQTWELGGRTLLVVGLGGIGTQVAKRAHALGMRVVATRGSDTAKPDYVDAVAGPDALLRLAGEADAVVNTAPLTPATTGLFDAKFFAAMKPTAYFINVGRGRSVVTADLVDALKNRRLAGAGLDVFDPEPLPPDNPLWQMPNVVITPHVAASSDKVFGRLLLMAQENLRRYAAGDRLLSVVDVERGY